MNLSNDTFSALDKGVNNTVYAFTANGNYIYAGGGFTQAQSGGNLVSALAMNYVGRFNLHHQYLGSDDRWCPVRCQ
jgi:hypothetical protein